MYYLYIETLIHSFDILHVHGRHARGIVDHENCSLDYVHVDELARPPTPNPPCFVRHGGMVYYVHAHVRQCVCCNLDLLRNHTASMQVRLHTTCTHTSRSPPSCTTYISRVCVCTCTQPFLLLLCCVHNPEPEMRGR